MKVLRSFLLLFIVFISTSVFAQDAQPTDSQPQTKIRVAMYMDKGVGKIAIKNFTPILESDPLFEMEQVNGQQIRDGILDNFDIFLLPGGMAGAQAESMQSKGLDKLKEFISSGKGYIGFCAGSYLPIEQLITKNVQCKTKNWRRGETYLQVEPSELGVKIFGEKYRGWQTCRYCNGAIVNINVNPILPPVQTLCWFRTEIAHSGAAPGNQVNSPAIWLTTYGKGTMIIISPHPEYSQELHGLVLGCLHHLVENLQYGKEVEGKKGMGDLGTKGPGEDVLGPSVPGSPSPISSSLRQSVVAYIRSMATVEWTAKEDMAWYDKKVTEPVYKKGETYKGIPYTQEYRWINLERFQPTLKAEDGKQIYNGPIVRDQYFGCDCSSACSFAWKSVCPDIPILSTIDIEPGKMYISSSVDGKTEQAFLKVGNYKMTKYDDSKAVVNEAGKDTMFAGYAQLLPGDAVVKRPDGHVALVSRVDTEQKIVYVIEQCGLHDGKLLNDHQSWRIDHPYTFDELFENGYLPVSPFFLNR